LIELKKQRLKTETCDVLVIGAGPAGSVAASMVRKGGLSVRVVEKEKFPRFVIGESLLPRCMAVLDDCGLLEAVKKKGFQEKFGAKFVMGDQVCDFNFSDQFSPGWTWTWQVPRAEFDSTLIHAVSQLGVPVDFETAVTAIEFLADGSSITTLQKKSGEIFNIKAKFIIDASGYGRVIPKLLKLDSPSNLPPRKAVFAHLEDPNRSLSEEPNRIIIVSYAPGAWAWVIPFSSGITSLGFVGSHQFFAKYSGGLNDVFISLINNLPFLQRRFGGSKWLFEPRQLEGWSVKTERFFGPGFVLTGNVTEFLDPIFSSGVMFATVSSHLAAQLVVKKLKGEDVNWHSDYSVALQSGVDTFRAFVMGWYDGTLEKIFYYKDRVPELKKQICSILAGYVWDADNPFVRNPEGELKRVVKLIDFKNRMDKLEEENA
jgi:flavin-dependent dehydrogenase